MRILTPLVLAAALSFVALPAAAQEEDTPSATVLMISYYQCPQDAIAEIAESYDTYTRPVEEEMVEDGVFTGAGLFFHWWADEWNVNYFRTGYDIADMLDAIDEVNATVVERNPELEDEPGPFAQCTAHKDGIYQFGPGTNRTPPPNGGG